MSGFTFTRPVRPVDTLLLVCSGSDLREDDDIAQLRRWDVDVAGDTDVSCHYYVRRDGLCQAGLALEKDAATIGTVTVCFGGLRRELFTLAQLRTGLSIVRAIYADYAAQGILVRVQGSTKFDHRLAFGIDGNGLPTLGPTVLPQPAVAPIATTAPPGDLYLLMPDGAQKVGALQVALNLARLGDDELGAALADLKVDGLFGRSTWLALRTWQHVKGLPVTGIAGSAERAALALA